MGRFFYHSFAISCFFLVGSLAFGQVSNESPSSGMQDEEEQQWAPFKEYSPEEKIKTCGQFEGQYISYYDSVYKVERCKTREVTDWRIVNQLVKSGVKIHQVSNEVMAKLDAGKPLNEIALKSNQNKDCHEFNDQYVTYNYVDIYLAQNCVLRAFPDWESFVEHRKKHHKVREPVRVLSQGELAQFKLGQPLPSVIDQEFRKQWASEKEIDLIPIKEACQGVNNRDVYFYDHIYHIENCRKRPYDAELYTRIKRPQKGDLIELSPEAWLSLPDGDPMPLPQIKRRR